MSMFIFVGWVLFMVSAALIGVCAVIGGCRND